MLRRDARHLQIGTSPGVVVEDRPGLRTFLGLLDGVRDVERLTRLARTEAPELERDVADVVRHLLATGAVLDANVRRGSRVRLRVALHDDPRCRPVGRAVAGVLADLGVDRLDPPDPDLLVVVSLGEPARAVFEHAHSDGIAHLPVVVEDDRVRLGPLVIPGRTPCLGCHDRHRAAWDRAWPALVPQLGRTPWSAAPPVPAPLAHAVAADVGAEVLAVATGSAPRTAGAVLAVGPAHDVRDRWPVAFHAACGCALLPAA